jgi:hypothetical protein
MLFARGLCTTLGSLWDVRFLLGKSLRNDAPKTLAHPPRLLMASMKPSAIPTFLVALVASALVWGLSPLITGHLEPWDADGLFYVGALAVTGIVAGGLFPRPLWAHYLGSVVGQLTYELIFLKLGPLFLLGIVFLLGYSVVFLVAAAIAARVRVYFTWSTF